jgi:hypothetical protein
MLKASIRGVWGVTGRGVYGEGEGVVQGQYFLQRILSSGLQPSLTTLSGLIHRHEVV